MKAQYSPVAPVHLLEQMFYKEHDTNQAHRYVGNYLLFLAHDVLAHPNDYHRLAYDIDHGYGNVSFYIMDNSVVELGTPINIKDVIKAADIVRASCIMTPDVLGSFPRTQEVVEKARVQLMESTYHLMRVPQGATPSELMQCVNWLRDALPIDFTRGEPEYWGIPRWVANEHGSREPIIQYINHINPDALIHLLGMSHSFEDDIACTKLPGVMGIDSANPLVFGQYRWLLGQDAYVHMDRGDYWKCTKLNGYMLHNLRFMHDACGN